MKNKRPCVVTETISKLVMGDELCSSLLAKDEKIEHKAIFHFWRERQRFYEQPYAGRYTQPSCVTETVAIVEYEDGMVREHPAHEIRFTDGKAKEIWKDKSDSWNYITDDTDSYPERCENVLFKLSDGRIYYGCCNAWLEWKIEVNDEHTYRIEGDVVAWRICKIENAKRN